MNVSYFLQMLLVLQCGQAQLQSSVLPLINENFAQALKANQMIFVCFYAPWCGHCKNLAPEFEKAAAFMHGRVAFAKVDATLEVELSEQYNVQGYPTLQLFKSGVSEDYTGGRQNESIVKWLEDHIGPPLTEVATDEELQNLLRLRRSSTYFVAKGDTALRDQFRTVAEDNLHLGVFFFVKGDPPAVEVHRGIDEVVNFEGDGGIGDGPLDLDRVHAFLMDAALPKFGKITDENYAAYAALAGQGLLWVCLDPVTVYQDADRLGGVFRDVAKAFRQFRVAYIDGNEYKEHLEEELGCTEFPSVVLQLGNFSNLDVDLKHYRTALPGEVTAEVVGTWISDVLAGKVEEDDDFEPDNPLPQEGESQAGAANEDSEEL